MAYEEIDRKKAKKLILVSIVYGYWPTYEQVKTTLIGKYGHFDQINHKWVWYWSMLEDAETYELLDIIRLIAPEQVYLVSLRIPEL